MNKMKECGVSIVALLLVVLPTVVSAQKEKEFGEVNTFIDRISAFIDGTLIPLVFGLALLMFIWGVFKAFILGGSDEEKQKEGKQLMLYAIIGFVVMVSIWGIVNLIANGLGFSTDAKIQNIPDIPTGQN
jgi:hypothetical protein